jgi:hypothetical protein
MPEMPIDLDALERVIGKAPPRYPAGDSRNQARIAWWNRAVHATGLLLARRGATNYLRVHHKRERIKGEGSIRP